jgi:hypothetical protein
MDRKKVDQLLIELSQYTSTTQYFRIGPRQLITDGVKHLADHAECYWLLDAAFSHLQEIGTADWFVLVRLEVKGSRATMYYEDGNGHEHARQEIPYTDFPLNQQKLYACWDGEHWVLMLPGEY